MLICNDCENYSYEVSTIYCNTAAYRILFNCFLCDLCYRPRVTKLVDNLYWLVYFKRLVLRIQSLEKNMDHPFSPNPQSLLQCKICNRAYKAHTENVECESCDFVGKCNVFNNMLLCDNCVAKSQEALKNEVKVTENLVESSKDLIDRANKIQDNLKYSGDFFNAETIAFIDIKKAFLSNSEIAESEREFAFHKHLVETIESNQRKIFDNNTENLTLTVQNSAAINILRDYGNSVREEFRERIKQSDAMYSPLNVKPVVPKLKKVTPTNAIERMVEQLALTMNISKEMARGMIEKGMQATRLGEEKISNKDGS